MATRSSKAEDLNRAIGAECPAALSMLSARGRAIYFPYAGILGQSAEAKGKKYNATIGIALEEDKTPMRLACLMKPLAVDPAKVLPYAPSFGLPELRARWKELMLEKNPGLKGKAVSLPVVTQALTHGLAVAAYLFLEAGEEILFPEPYWDNYDLLFGVSFGARVTTFPCYAGGGFDVAGLRRVLAARRGGKIALLLNFPNNPTGYTPTESEMAGLAEALAEEAAQGSRIVAIIDDAYFGLVYEPGVARDSLFARIADAHPNLLAVKVDGATKEDYVWGLRVGFISFAAKGAGLEALAALEDKAAGSVRALISNCSHLSQTLLLEAFKSGDYAREKRAKHEVLKHRYEVLKREIETHPEYARSFAPLPYNSGYFMCLKPAPGLDAEKLRRRLLEKYDTGLIAMQGLLRIAFSSVPAGDLPTIVRNVHLACEEGRGGA